MSEHEKETAFLRHVILYDESGERHGLEERITQVERNERCVRGAVWLMALLTALAAAGLCYAAIFLEDFPQNKSQFILKVFGGLGLGSLICLPAFAGFWMVHRRELDERREECRRLIKKLLESRLGKPRVRSSSSIIKEPDAHEIVATSRTLETDNEQMKIKNESNIMTKASKNMGSALNIIGLILSLSAVALVGGLTGCAGNRYTQSTGERIDDQADSSRVRKALSADTQYKYGAVVVQTFKGVVQLSGFVNSRDQKNRAGDLARRVEGVREVENNITVKESTN